MKRIEIIFLLEHFTHEMPHGFCRAGMGSALPAAAGRLAAIPSLQFVTAFQSFIALVLSVRLAGAATAPVTAENDSKVLANAMRNERLQSSPEIRDQLQHYKTSIPMNNAEFRKHSDRVYPTGLGKPKNPLYGKGWCNEWLPKDNEVHGEAARAALKDVIDRYFGKGEEA